MNPSHAGFAFLVLVLAGCSSNPTSTRPPAGAIIGVHDFAFDPETTTVKAGTVVEWDNAGPSTHTVTSDSSVWTSMTLVPPGSSSDPYGGGSSAGGYFQFTFRTAGTFPFHCTIHAQMHGVVVVTP